MVADGNCILTIRGVEADLTLRVLEWPGFNLCTDCQGFAEIFAKESKATVFKNEQLDQEITTRPNLAENDTRNIISIDQQENADRFLTTYQLAHCRVRHPPSINQTKTANFKNRSRSYSYGRKSPFAPYQGCTMGTQKMSEGHYLEAFKNSLRKYKYTPVCLSKSADLRKKFQNNKKRNLSNKRKSRYGKPSSYSKNNVKPSRSLQPNTRHSIQAHPVTEYDLIFDYFKADRRRDGGSYKINPIIMSQSKCTGCAFKLSEVDKAIYKQIDKWQREIPVYPHETKDQRRLRNQMIQNLREDLISMSNEHAFSEKARQSIKECLETLPMWLPQESDAIFKEKIAHRLMIKLDDEKHKARNSNSNTDLFSKYETNYRHNMIILGNQEQTEHSLDNENPKTSTAALYVPEVGSRENSLVCENYEIPSPDYSEQQAEITLSKSLDKLKPVLLDQANNKAETFKSSHCRKLLPELTVNESEKDVDLVSSSFHQEIPVFSSNQTNGRQSFENSKPDEINVLETVDSFCSNYKSLAINLPKSAIRQEIFPLSDQEKNLTDRNNNESVSSIQNNRRQISDRSCNPENCVSEDMKHQNNSSLEKVNHHGSNYRSNSKKKSRPTDLSEQLVDNSDRWNGRQISEAFPHNAISRISERPTDHSKQLLDNSDRRNSRQISKPFSHNHISRISESPTDRSEQLLDDSDRRNSRQIPEPFSHNPISRISERLTDHSEQLLDDSDRRNGRQISEPFSHNPISRISEHIIPNTLSILENINGTKYKSNSTTMSKSVIGNEEQTLSYAVPVNKINIKDSLIINQERSNFSLCSNRKNKKSCPLDTHIYERNDFNPIPSFSACEDKNRILLNAQNDNTPDFDRSINHTNTSFLEKGTSNVYHENYKSRATEKKKKWMTDTAVQDYERLLLDRKRWDKRCQQQTLSNICEHCISELKESENEMHNSDAIFDNGNNLPRAGAMCKSTSISRDYEKMFSGTSNGRNNVEDFSQNTKTYCDKCIEETAASHSISSESPLQMTELRYWLEKTNSDTGHCFRDTVPEKDEQVECAKGYEKTKKCKNVVFNTDNENEIPVSDFRQRIKMPLSLNAIPETDKESIQSACEDTNERFSIDESEKLQTLIESKQADMEKVIWKIISNMPELTNINRKFVKHLVNKLTVNLCNLAENQTEEKEKIFNQFINKITQRAECTGCFLEPKILNKIVTKLLSKSLNIENEIWDVISAIKEISTIPKSDITSMVKKLARELRKLNDTQASDDEKQNKILNFLQKLGIETGTNLCVLDPAARDTLITTLLNNTPTVTDELIAVESTVWDALGDLPEILIFPKCKLKSLVKGLARNLANNKYECAKMVIEIMTFLKYINCRIGSKINTKRRDDFCQNLLNVLMNRFPTYALSKKHPKTYDENKSLVCSFDFDDTIENNLQSEVEYDEEISHRLDKCLVTFIARLPCEIRNPDCFIDSVKSGIIDWYRYIDINSSNHTDDDTYNGIKYLVFRKLKETTTTDDAVYALGNIECLISQLKEIRSYALFKTASSRMQCSKIDTYKEVDEDIGSLQLHANYAATPNNSLQANSMDCLKKCSSLSLNGSCDDHSRNVSYRKQYNLTNEDLDLTVPENYMTDTRRPCTANKKYVVHSQFQTISNYSKVDKRGVDKKPALVSKDQSLGCIACKKTTCNCKRQKIIHDNIPRAPSPRRARKPHKTSSSIKLQCNKFNTTVGRDPSQGEPCKVTKPRRPLVKTCKGFKIDKNFELKNRKLKEKPHICKPVQPACRCYRKPCQYPTKYFESKI